MLGQVERCRQIVTKYIRDLHEDFQTQSLEDACLIITPYLLPNDDAIEVVVKPKNGRYEISDMGTTIGFLYLSGVDLRQHSKQEAHFQAQVARFGVKILQGELVIEAPESEIIDALRRIIEASKSISYLVYTTRTRPGADFRRVVAEWFEENHVETQSSVQLPGVSGKLFTIDFVRERREAPPLYIKTLHSETRGWAKSVVYEAVVHWVELKETKRRFESVSFLDDSVEEDVWSEHIPLLKAHSDRLAFWETKEELLETLIE